MRRATLLSSMLAAAILAACGGGGAEDSGTEINSAQTGMAQAAAALETRLAATPTSSLSSEESAGLTFTREEEKVARDVYLALHERWQLKVFQNISASEQTHMDAMLTLLNRYGLTDPAAGLLNGKFANADLQALYNKLLSAGLTSGVDALKVGAEIEEMDIRDLELAKVPVDNADILLVYNNLEKGSRNHLRAFYDNLVKQGASYTPKYISQQEFDAIVNSPRETGSI